MVLALLGAEEVGELAEELEQVISKNLFSCESSM